MKYQGKGPHLAMKLAVSQLSNYFLRVNGNRKFFVKMSVIRECFSSTLSVKAENPLQSHFDWFEIYCDGVKRQNYIK